MLPDVALVRLPLVNFSEMVSAVSSARLVNVATPPDTVAVKVPWSGPVPLPSAAVTTVLLSPVSRLHSGPLHKSRAGSGTPPPAVAVDEGCVWITNWVAAAGLTTTLLDVAVKLPALVVKARFIVSALL